MIKQKLLQNLKIALKKIGIKEEEVSLEHPTNPNFGDYATSIALKLAGKILKGNFLENIDWLLKNINKNNYKDHIQPLPIAKLSKKVKNLIKSKEEIVYLKPKVYAKIRGLLPLHKSHLEITNNYFYLLPIFLHFPAGIFKDKKNSHVYHLVIDINKSLDIVIDLSYWKEEFAQINTIFFTRENYLKNFIPIKKVSDEGATVPLFSSGQLKGWLGAGSRFSSLHQKPLLYNKLSKQSQEDILTYQIKKSPPQIAQEIANNFPKNDLVEKIEIIKPGFINFWLSKKYLVSTALEFAQNKFYFPPFHLGKTKKIMVEFAHPNTHKLFHIGHLRNISSGESVCRILEAVGNRVIRANYQGDVGLHIAKCLWQVKSQKLKVKSLKNLRDKIKFLGDAYAKGNKAYETSEKVKKEIIKINRLIYKKDPQILPLWKETRQWSLDYFSQIYKKVYGRFDRFYFESEVAERGKEISLTALKKGVLKKSENAIIFNGKSDGLDNRVFVNALGFPTYEGKELALAEKEFSEFGEIDKCIHVVGPEQSSFFKVIFRVEELLDPKKYKNTQSHLVAGLVRLKHGKMSSRSGVVVEGPWLIDEAKRRIIKKYHGDEKTAETIAVASVKYSFLKNNISADISFDFDESISLEGNSAPYLLYTYVRSQNVLKKIDINTLTMKQFKNLTIEQEENDLLRAFYQFPEVVFEAAKNLSPSLIANYLFDLAQKYNLFYQKHQILKAEENKKDFRLILTAATGQIIKNGLYLLGIKTVEKM